MKKTFLAAAFSATVVSPVMAVEVSDQLEINGLFEVEYGAIRSGDEHDYGTALATGALGVVLKPTDQFDIVTTWLYEEDLHAVATPLETDEAYITWHALPDAKLDIAAGKRYLPFGTFETAMIADPLTLELGETRQDKVLQASTSRDKWNASGYAFQGEEQDGYGLALWYGTETVQAGVDYLSSFQESDAAAVAVHSAAQLGKTTLVAEHLTAVDALDDGNKPSASHLEANYDLGKDRTAALAWNKTQAASSLDLPKQMYGVAYRQPLYKDLQGAVELQQSKAYDGMTTKAFTAQIAYEF